MIKLIDIEYEVDENVTFGTCELCMSVGDHHYEVFVFQDGDGMLLEIENGHWDWGDYNRLFYDLGNYAEIAQWFIDNPINKTFSELGGELKSRDFMINKLREYEHLKHIEERREYYE